MNTCLFISHACLFVKGVNEMRPVSSHTVLCDGPQIKQTRQHTQLGKTHYTRCLYTTSVRAGL